MMRRVFNPNRFMVASNKAIAASTFALRYNGKYVNIETDAAGHRIYKSTQNSVMKDVEEHRTFHECFIGAASQHRSDVAFIDGTTEEKITYGHLLQDIDRFAAVLYHTYNIRKGSVVALLSPNTTGYAAIFQSIIRLGGVVTTMNPTFTPEEVKKQLILSGAQVLVSISPMAKLAEAAALETKIPLLMADQRLPGAPPVPNDYKFDASPDDTIVLPFSSGTTGFPKGVQLTNKNLVANVYQTQEAITFHKTDVMMSVLPFFHIYGMVVLLHGIINVGGTQVIMPKFDMVQYLSLLEKYKATLLFVAPPIMVGFVKHPQVAKTNTDSVRLVFSGAAPLTEEIQKMNEPIFKNSMICQGYGLTETSPVLTASPKDQVSYGSCGVLAADTEMRIVKVNADEDSNTSLSGDDAPVGEEGEMWCRGPQVMKGYLNKEDTAKVFPEEGWFRTGDLVSIDEEGNVFIKERLKELIKYKGFQVAPAELEGLIQQHDDVVECIVVGVPTADGTDEVPRAQVVLKPHVAADADKKAQAPQTIIDFVASKTTHYKHLRGGVKVVEAIPKTASGKLLRRVVRAEEVNAMKQQ